MDKNEAEAVKIYTRLAEAGSVPAMIQLGRCLDAGRGAEKNADAARDWWRKAVAAGSEEAAKLLAPESKPAEQPAPQPAEQPAPQPAEQPAPQPAEQPAPQPAEQPQQ